MNTDAKTTSILITRTDTRAEIDLVCELAKRAGAFDAVPCYHWSTGGKGSVDLARAVRDAANKGSRFQFLYDVQVSPHHQDNSGLVALGSCRRLVLRVLCTWPTSRSLPGGCAEKEAHDMRHWHLTRSMCQGHILFLSQTCALKALLSNSGPKGREGRALGGKLMLEGTDLPATRLLSKFTAAQL